MPRAALRRASCTGRPAPAAITGRPAVAAIMTLRAVEQAPHFVATGSGLRHWSDPASGGGPKLRVGGNTGCMPPADGAAVVTGSRQELYGRAWK